jgi:predicted Zn-dependent peptidase
MIENIKETRLKNGLAVLTDQMPGVRSVTLAFFFRTGSRNEPDGLNGITHFIEHAVFKGTATRSALDIAIEQDRLGGTLEAFTTHEEMGFAIKVTDDQLEPAFELVADMLCNPQFDEKEMRSEQKVIIEEMKMIEDTPDELLTELFHAAYFPDHSLGRPIEGTEQTVSSFDHDTTAAFHAANFDPQNLVLAAAGNIAHQQLTDLAVKVFDKRKSPAGCSSSPSSSPKIAAPILIERKKELEQAHLILAAPWPSAKSSDRYAASMLATVLGGGTSSRLWQSIREERGLAYSIGAGGNTYTDVGVFTIYAGTSPAQMDQVLDLAMAEVRRIVREPVSEIELQSAKEQAISSVLLSLESSSARAGTLARQEIVLGHRISPDKIIKSVEAVTREDVLRVAQSCFTTPALALGALGNLNGFKVDRTRLEI